ncbi:MAG: DUF1501 domain-containing protein, partial [Bacteroidota bacterium]
MKRRKFLKLSAPAAISPLLLNGLPIHTFASPRMISAFNCDGIGERVLVLIQLSGGNDGLNTLVPIEQYDVYRNMRPTIGISNQGLGKYISLDSSLPLADQIGLHPSMVEVKDLYDQGKVRLVQGVAYTDQNGSHFKSTDLWMTGGDGTTAYNNLGTGWMGRYLDYTFPGLAGNPSNLMPDPLGIQLGNSKPSIGFYTGGEHSTGINLSNQNLSGFYNVVSELGGPALQTIPESEYGDELQYIMNIENSVSNYAERITTVFNQGQNALTYPNYNLANQLKTVARLIEGGCRTKIYLLNIGGFDTHTQQILSGDPSQGTHAQLMLQISQSVKAFLDDIEALGIDDKILTATFSEFGRTPFENGNEGTDHGTLAPMMLFGKSVEPGISGTNVNLNDLDGDQLQYQQFDYRQVYTSLLQDWLGASDEALVATRFDQFISMKLPIINTNYVVAPECYQEIALPVSLSAFSATLVDEEVVQIDWTTAQEIDSDFFEVERSADSRDFELLETLEAAGRSATEQRYQTYDEDPLPGISYYRLRQVDIDGRSEYSNIVAIALPNEPVGPIKLYPNPAIYDVNLTISSNRAVEAQLSLIAMNGRQLLSNRIRLEEGFNKITRDISDFP